MKPGDLVTVTIGSVTSEWRVVRLEPEFAARADAVEVVDNRRPSSGAGRPGVDSGRIQATPLYKNGRL